MNANIIKMHFFLLNEVWPQRSLKATKVYLKISKSSFSALHFLLNALFKTVQEYQQYKCPIFFINWSMTLKVMQGHIRPFLCQNHSGTLIYGPILMKICMNANIINTHFFHKILWPEMSPYVMEKFYYFEL